RFSQEGRYVVKEIELRNEGRSFQERVRLFTADGLGALLGGDGLRGGDRFGDYGGGRLAADSPRSLLLGGRRRFPAFPPPPARRASRRVTASRDACPRRCSRQRCRVPVATAWRPARCW